MCERKRERVCVRERKGVRISAFVRERDRSRQKERKRESGKVQQRSYLKHLLVPYSAWRDGTLKMLTSLSYQYQATERVREMESLDGEIEMKVTV